MKPESIKRIDVDNAIAFDVKFDINIDEDKKDLIDNHNNKREEL